MSRTPILIISIVIGALFLGHSPVAAANSQDGTFFTNEVDTTIRIRDDIDVPIKWTVTSEVKAESETSARHVYRYTVENHGPTVITLEARRGSTDGIRCLLQLLSVTLDPGSVKSLRFVAKHAPLAVQLPTVTRIYDAGTQTWKPALGGILHVYLPFPSNQDWNCHSTGSD